MSKTVSIRKYQVSRQRHCFSAVLLRTFYFLLSTCSLRHPERSRRIYFRTKSQEPRFKTKTLLQCHPERSRRNPQLAVHLTTYDLRLTTKIVSRQRHRFSAVLLHTFYFVLSTLSPRHPERSRRIDLRLTLLTFYFLLCAEFSLHAQLLTPLSGEMNRRVEYRIFQTSPEYFTVIKPYLQSDSIYPSFKNAPKPSSSSWLKRKLFYESLVEVDSGDLYLFFDPVFDFSLGRDNAGRNTFTNTRGFIAGGRLGKHFAFGTDFYENQAILPNWIQSGIQNKIITGQGRGRLNNQTWDYAHSSGYLSYSPIKALNIQLGQGKNFIGDGYRSLLLSDVAYNYPYSRMTFFSKRIMYSWMLGMIQDLSISNKGDKFTFGKRIISSHVLSANLLTQFQISVIKNTVYNNPDTTGVFTSTIEEFNPVMLPVNSSRSNSIWGINVRLVIKNNIWLYGQMVLDNLFDEGTFKKGFQIGSKYYEAFGLKGLCLQAEYNSIDRETYTSQNKTLHWFHYGEPLAHPLGNNLNEGLLNIVYTWRRWQFEGFFRFSQQLADGNSIGSGVNSGFPEVKLQKDILHSYVQLNWFLNPKTTSLFSLGYIVRNEKISGVNNCYNMISFSFRTALFNSYLNY